MDPSPSPAPTDTDQAFALLLGQRQISWLDSDGRCLGEQASRGYRQTPVEERPCPWPDARSRTDLPMNTGALHQITDHWAWILDTLSLLLQSHTPTGAPPTLFDAWCVNDDANTLATWLRLRADLPGPIPAPVSALYKASLGFRQLYPQLLLRSSTAALAPLHESWPLDGFWAMLDSEEWLIGSHQVCAGPRAWILRYHGLLSQTSPQPPALPLPTHLPPAPGVPPVAVSDLMNFGHLHRELFALTTAWIAAAAWSSAHNHLDEVPDYSLDPTPEQRARWPSGLALYHQDRLPVTALIRSQALMSPSRAVLLYPEDPPLEPHRLAAFLFAQGEPSDTPLARNDALYLELASDLMQHLLLCAGLANPRRLTSKALQLLIFDKDSTNIPD